MTNEINAGIRKCPYCAQRIVIKEEAQIWYNEHYYHNKCFEQFSSKYLGLTPSQVEKLKQEKLDLINYVASLFDEEYMNQKFSTDLVFLLRKNYKYSGIKAALEFYINVKKRELTYEYGISTVQFVYSEAARYWTDFYNMQDKLASQSLKVEPKIVYITVKNNSDIKSIDMNNL